MKSALDPIRITSSEEEGAEEAEAWRKKGGDCSFLFYDPKTEEQIKALSVKDLDKFSSQFQFEALWRISSANSLSAQDSNAEFALIQTLKDDSVLRNMARSLDGYLEFNSAYNATKVYKFLTSKGSLRSNRQKKEGHSLKQLDAKDLKNKLEQKKLDKKFMEIGILRKRIFFACFGSRRMGQE
eukprot:Nk52_evm1s369 gene=Nk52_evmTU1s369